MEKSNKNSITFFTPSLQKTGSEIVLFNLLPYILKSHKATVITKHKGVLYEKISPEIQKVYLYKKPLTDSFVSRFIHKIRREFIIPKIFKKQENSFWYLNTIMLPEVLKYAKENNIAACVHVHELQQMYTSLKKEQIETLLTFPKFIIANSIASKSVLREMGCKLPIEIIYPAIDTNEIKADEEKKIIYRAKLKIKPTDFVWVMSGTLDGNKNPLLFIEITKALKQKTTNFKMMWLGDSPIKNLYAEECKKTATQLGLSDDIIWAGNIKEDYYNYLNCADGFVLTSKKESFSLVTLEALLLGLPVVATNCEGVNEILKNDVGVITKTTTNAEEMAYEMNNFMQGIYKTNIDKGRMRAKKFDIKVWGNKWSEVLNSYFAKELF